MLNSETLNKSYGESDLLPSFDFKSSIKQRLSFWKTSYITPVIIFFKTLDNNLNRLPILNQISDHLRIKRPLLVFITTFSAFVFIQNAIGYAIFFDMLGIYYPAWMSFKSIESTDKDNQIRWLTYWVVFSFFNFLKYPFDICTFWFPFRRFLKLCLIGYICLPQFNGTHNFYNFLVRPFLIKHQLKVESTIYNLKLSINQGFGSIIHNSINNSPENFIENATKDKLYLTIDEKSIKSKKFNF